MVKSISWTKRVDLRNLQTAINADMKDVQTDFLRIKADRDADVGTLISVIDEVRLTGVRELQYRYRERKTGG